MNVFDQIKHQWKVGGYAQRLLFINVAVYVTVFLLGILENLFRIPLASFLLNNLMFHAKLEELVWRPWVFITANFTHQDFWHIFWNMVIFYYISQIFVQLIGQRKLLSVYLVGGIACFVSVFLGYQFISFTQYQNSTGLALGASGSVYAVFIYLVMHRPRYEVKLFGLIKVPLFFLALIYVAQDLVNIRSYGENFGGSIGHLGGAAYGFISYYAFTKGKNLEAWMEKILDRKWKLSDFFKREKLEVKYKRAAADKKQTRDDATYNRSKKEQQEIVDAILDKIGKHGYEGLTKEEKAILFDASKNQK